jgi:hypothetical protein
MILIRVLLILYYMLIGASAFRAQLNTILWTACVDWGGGERRKRTHFDSED